MKIHCVRHEPFEGLASIEDWISENKAQLTFTLTYLNQQFPEDIDFDLLIIMGGTASVYDDTPWLKEELEFIAKAVEHKKKILGICLGAQLIASTLKAKVYAGAEREIGWFPVTFNPDGAKGLSFLPDQLVVFHWHGDTFDLPQGSIRLASSESTPNQGFIYKGGIIGLQFHLEMTQTSLKKITRGARKDLEVPGRYVQTAHTILQQEDQFPATQKLLFSILNYLRDFQESA